MQILLDNVPYNIGQTLPENIEYCDIQFHPMELSIIQYPIQQKADILQWFQTIKDKAKIIFLNNIIYQQKETTNEIQ